MFLYSSCTEFKGDHGFLRFCWFLKPGDISNIYMDFLFYTFPTLLFFQNSLEIYCCLFICYFSALQLIYLLMSYFRFVTSFEKYEFLYAIQRYTQAERERESSLTGIQNKMKFELVPNGITVLKVEALLTTPQSQSNDRINFKK